ncbi:MAG TPA: ABC transporter ATP-binding protein, partial [Corynebacterium sp.]|nr:ABC transporter ATP-binding protein [Corynebacterium sp.]
LESLLDSWPGTLVVISHDRYLIERIADSTWALFGDGQLTNLPRGIEQYLEVRAQQAEAAGSGPLDLGERDQAPVEKQSGLSSQEERELRKQMQALERKMSRIDERIAAFEQEMAVLSAAADPDYGKIADANTALNEAREEHEELEMEWLEVGEQLEG